MKELHQELLLAGTGAAALQGAPHRLSGPRQPGRHWNAGPLHRSTLWKLGVACMASQTLDEVIRRAVHFLREHGQRADINVDRMLLGLSEEEREEAEANPCHLLTQAMGGSLREATECYLRSTRYLLPLLHSYSSALAAFSHAQGEALPIYLFMRDALVFWPTLRALDLVSEEQIHLIFYSRKDARAGRPPVALSHQSGRGPVEAPLHHIKRGLLADVGLYGSLLYTMLKAGTCARDVSVLFFGSRNPFLAGWLNMVLSANILLGDTTVDLHDVIIMVDTVESLLKPYRVAEDGALEIAEPVAFTCSMAFLWSLYRYAKRPKAPGSLGCFARALRQAKKGRKYWLVNKAVPRWEEADRFIASWDLGPLAPMDKLCGFNL